MVFPLQLAGEFRFPVSIPYAYEYRTSRAMLRQRAVMRAKTP